MVNNLDVNTQASVKLLIIKCTHACLYVQGRSVHWHLKLPHSPFHLSLLLNSHICILKLKLEILSQIAFSVVPSFDVYLVIHRKKRDWLSPMSRHENARLRDNRAWVDVKWYWWKEYSFWGWRTKPRKIFSQAMDTFYAHFT